MDVNVHVESIVTVHDDKLIGKWVNIDPRMPEAAKPDEAVAKATE